jgi:hypothetical protein
MRTHIYFNIVCLYIYFKYCTYILYKKNIYIYNRSVMSPEGHCVNLIFSLTYGKALRVVSPGEIRSELGCTETLWMKAGHWCTGVQERQGSQLGSGHNACWEMLGLSSHENGLHWLCFKVICRRTAERWGVVCAVAYAVVCAHDRACADSRFGAWATSLPESLWGKKLFYRDGFGRDHKFTFGLVKYKYKLMPTRKLELWVWSSR